MKAANFLYLISRPPGEEFKPDWEENIAAVVVARDDTHARTINPDGKGEFSHRPEDEWDRWPHPKDVVATYIGIASMDAKDIASKTGGVVLRSNKGA